MFNTQCVRQLSFVSSGFAVEAGGTGLARLLQRARMGIDETAIVFAGAALGLGGSTVIVLRALSQAF